MSGKDYIKCSNCGATADWATPMCPNCGQTLDDERAVQKKFAASLKRKTKSELIDMLVEKEAGTE